MTRISWAQILGLALLLGTLSAAFEILPTVAQPAGGTVPPALGLVLSACNPGVIFTAGTYAPVTINTAGQVCNSI